MLNIEDFDSVSPCETAQELELTGVDGMTSTGVTLLVIGDHADSVKKYYNAGAKKSAISIKNAEKSGKVDELLERTIDSRETKEVEGACVRVTGWKGVTQPFSRELLANALKRNPHWVNQIVKFSENLGNFTK